MADAARRLAQVLFFCGGGTALALWAWKLLTVPQDARPWFLIAAAAAATALPPAVWWYEATRGRPARAAQVAASWFAVVAGAALLFGFSAQAASLFTHQYSGPMAAEGMIFGLAWSGFAGSVSVFLALSPLLLDRTLLTPSRRAFWRRVAVAGLLVVIVLGVFAGPRILVSMGASSAEWPLSRAPSQ